MGESQPDPKVRDLIQRHSGNPKYTQWYVNVIGIPLCKCRVFMLFSCSLWNDTLLGNGSLALKD